VNQQIAYRILQHFNGYPALKNFDWKLHVAERLAKLDPPDRTFFIKFHSIVCEGVIFKHGELPSTYTWLMVRGESNMRQVISDSTRYCEYRHSYKGDLALLKQAHKLERKRMTKKLRDSIFLRDHYKCKHCGWTAKNKPSKQLRCDHIVPVSLGGLTVPENLQTLCFNCNSRKSNYFVG